MQSRSVVLATFIETSPFSIFLNPVFDFLNRVFHFPDGLWIFPGLDFYFLGEFFIFLVVLLIFLVRFLIFPVGFFIFSYRYAKLSEILAGKWLEACGFEGGRFIHVRPLYNTIVIT